MRRHERPEDANGFLHFIKLAPPSTPLGGEFMTAATGSHFMILIFLLQLVSGRALLAGAYVPLALVVLADILVTILDYHLTMDRAGFASRFRTIFATKPEPST